MTVTWYLLFKAMHVVAAVIWVGGAAFSAILGHRVSRSGHAEQMARFSGDMEAIGVRLFMPSAVALLISAIAMMFNGDLEWGQLWVVYGLLVWFLAFLLGVAFFGPQTVRLNAVIELQGPHSLEARRRMRQLLTVSDCELVLLVGVVWAMVLKLTLDGSGAGWVIGSAAVLVLALAWVGRELVTGPDAETG
jgi:uncharacterized membrane protein